MQYTIYDESQHFLKKRAALYGEALEAWLKKWAAEKRVQHDPIYRDLSLELEQALLADIAYKSFAEDQLFFTKREITSQIRAFLVNNLNAPKHLDAEAVLNAIQVQQGILIERARDAYSFSHLTFQEYLTAQYVVDERQEEALVTQHLSDDRWREVFLLVAGLRSADELLKQMEREMRKFIDTEKLKSIVYWAEQITADSEGNHKPAAKRAVALFCALDLSIARARRTRACAHDLNFTRDLEFALEFTRNFLRALEVAHDLARDLARDFAHDLSRVKAFNSVDFSALIDRVETLQVQILKHNEPPDTRIVFVDQIQQTWYDALRLNPEWSDLSNAEMKSLRDYLYANELIVRCKEAAVRVSPQVWESIESRMLTVRED